MDIITAQRLVEGTEEGLRECARDFEGVKCAADEFVKWANGKLEEEEECELAVQTALPEKRFRKKKRMPGELAEDEQLASADTDFKYNLLTDAYHVIGLAYKLLLTLSITQVASQQAVKMERSLWCEEAEGEQSPQTSGSDSPQLRAPWDPTVSGHRVIQSLLHVEERYMPSMLYITLIQRDPERREELTKWALEACCDCCCDEAVFPLSVSLMDRFLSATLSLPISPYCLAAGCILIASKLAECDNVTADALCAAAEYSFQPSNLREMERIILATLRWDTAAVTPQDFLPHFVASVEERGDSQQEPLSTLRRHGDTLAAMCVCDSRFLGAPPSLVAAASLNCALRGLGNKGPTQLALVSETLADLCQTDPAVLQFYSEKIEDALRQRLRAGLQQGPTEKGEEVEDERPGTPTDMTAVDF
ncbi:cyclin Dx [Cololabis saira]|uniref:cyclin Dx n=1 Tax=Cololabis saira TaxID=129043 RepID=UPI002AD44B84|nr:cyclin Dx [Cololabis saira]